MKSLIRDVRAFHEACDHPVLDAPRIVGERVVLRRELLAEEFYETMDALRVHDLEGVADGLADLIYVAVGMAVEFGIPLDRVWDEVQRANMAKVDPATGKVRRREDGKILKPEGWQAPDIAKAVHGD